MESTEEVLIEQKVIGIYIRLNSMQKSNNFWSILVLNTVIIGENNVQIEDIFQPNMN
jgi:hypothetical protein